MEKLEPSYIAGGNVKLYSCFGKMFGSSSKKLNTELPYDPAISLLAIYSREFKVHIHIKTGARILNAALFITAEKWKRAKYSIYQLTNE